MSSKEKNEELVVLSFNNTQGGSNWTEFCRLQSRYQIAKYGDFGRFILDGKHYEEARIQKPVRGEGVDDEEWEIVVSEYKDARKRQNKSAYARLLSGACLLHAKHPLRRGLLWIQRFLRFVLHPF